MKETEFKTKWGELYLGDSTELISNKLLRYHRGRINLILTSPPFPLNNKKKYGNLKGERYQEWFISLAPLFKKLLTEDGSIVMEVGNSWEPGRPIQSLLYLESLLGFVKEADLRLIQEFVCYNPARLPSPAQWVTINRIRTVDSYTHIWWIAKSDYPKADNKKILRPYSKSMKSLLNRKSYNDGYRPSEHKISEKGFLRDHGGSIAHNFFELEPIYANRDVRLPQNVLSHSNTDSNSYFLNECRRDRIIPHPARMNIGVANFFIKFLTDPQDTILDPFAGSGTSCFSAEMLERKWLGIEINKSYIDQVKIRFRDPQLKKKIPKNVNNK